MVCYWKPDEGLDSVLNIFFDKSVDENLPGDSLFKMCVDLADMFEKLAVRHAAFVDACPRPPERNGMMVMTNPVFKRNYEF